MRFKFLLFLLGCTVLIGLWNFRGHDTEQEKFVIVSIPPGSSAKEIVAALVDKGLIKSERWFLSLVKLRNASGRLYAGVYRFRPSASSWHILTSLISGKTHKVKVTVPEGYSAWQISERLETLGVCGGDEFLELARMEGYEGYLFPETYFFDINTPPDQIIKVMTGQFRVAFLGVLARAEKSSLGSWTAGKDGAELKSGIFRFADGRKFTGHQVVTLASIIEREAKVDVERPIVSAVFHNRLKKRWLLESCATVQYALGEWKTKLRYKDLEVDSPYNTYKKRGLPPGPICNPGASSIRAALGPADSDAMYFLADEKGTHYFYTNYREHIRGKRTKKRRRKSKD